MITLEDVSNLPSICRQVETTPAVQSQVLSLWQNQLRFNYSLCILKSLLLRSASAQGSHSALCRQEAHAGLVHPTWKFTKNEEAVRMIKDMLASFPSCCVPEEEAKPVSWILLSLITLPEHRGKGYAKVLVSAMAKRLHAEGHPVYCYMGGECSFLHIL